MPAAGAVGRAGAERLIHEALDRAHAAPALRAASEAAMHVNSRARRRFRDGGADLMIGQHVAGADDHVRMSEPVSDVTNMAAYQRIAKEKRTLNPF